MIFLVSITFHDLQTKVLHFQISGHFAESSCSFRFSWSIINHLKWNSLWTSKLPILTREEQICSTRYQNSLHDTYKHHLGRTRQLPRKARICLQSSRPRPKQQVLKTKNETKKSKTCAESAQVHTALIIREESASTFCHLSFPNASRP